MVAGAGDVDELDELDASRTVLRATADDDEDGAADDDEDDGVDELEDDGVDELEDEDEDDDEDGSYGYRYAPMNAAVLVPAPAMIALPD